MKLFRRTDTGDKVPAELEPYYENRGGWRLWVRRIVAVAVLLALLFLLAWGARGLYNRVTDDGADQGGKTNNQLTEEKRDRDNQQDKKPTEQQGGAARGGGTAPDQPSGDRPTNNGGTTTQNNQGQTSGTATDQPSQQTDRSGGQATVPASGDESGNMAAKEGEPLPNTGPEDALVTALAAGIFGGLMHRFILSRRSIRD